MPHLSLVLLGPFQADLDDRPATGFESNKVRAMLIYLAVVRLLLLQPIGDRPLTLLAILLTMLGVQLVTTGLLAEMVSRTYYESQGKRIYTVREELPRCEE